MRKGNIIFFIVILVIIFIIFGFAIWDANQNMNKLGENSGIMQNVQENEAIQNELQGDNSIVNENNTNLTTQSSNIDYVGIWYIDQDAYSRSERIDDIMDRREENRISEEEFQTEMQSESNKNIVELDVEEYFQNKIKFDFELTSPAPNQREGKIEDIVVDLNNGIGTFTYTDNWLSLIHI